MFHRLQGHFSAVCRQFSGTPWEREYLCCVKPTKQPGENLENQEEITNSYEKVIANWAEQ